VRVSAWARPEKAAAADRMDRATMRVAFMISSSKSKVEQEVSGVAGFLQAWGLRFLASSASPWTQL